MTKSQREEDRTSEAIPEKTPAVIDPYGKRVHYLKTWPFPFEDVAAGRKPFEYRAFDRDFRVGDTLALEKYDPHSKTYCGVCIDREVTYVLPGGTFGVPDGYCVLGLKEIRHPLDQRSADATVRTPSAKVTPQCPRGCSECEGDHCLIDFIGMVCKHCEAIAEECHACEEGTVYANDEDERPSACEACNGSGFRMVQMPAVIEAKETFLDGLRNGGLAASGRAALESLRDNPNAPVSDHVDALVAMDLIAQHGGGWRVTAAGLHVLCPVNPRRERATVVCSHQLNRRLALNANGEEIVGWCKDCGAIDLDGRWRSPKEDP